MMPRIVIIGAGPAGLGAAYRLHELGHNTFHVYERHGYLGGLSASFTDKMGFTWDIGGHVMFSHYDYFDRVFATLMGTDFQLNVRESWIRMFDTWVPYPFQNNIRYLPPEVCFECLSGLIKARAAGDPATAANCRQFMERIFGAGICKHFMVPYNFKVWAHPLEMLNKQWMGQRVAMIDIERALRNVVLQQDDFGWGPNNQFKFPLMGGTGEFYRRFASPLAGHISTRREVAGINMRQRQVRFSDGRRETYDALLSTMPLNKLCGMIEDGLPAEISAAARQLRHSGGHMIGVGLRQPCPSTRSWMYFPESNSPFYRVTYLSNYSPQMTPERGSHYSLLCETSYSEFKKVDPANIVRETIRGLINSGLLTERDQDDIVSIWHHEADYSYPTPSLERDAALARIIPYLDSQRIYSRGRFGMWKYEVANTDHTLMQGVELVNHLLLGRKEETIGLSYALEGDGQLRVTNERAAVAGSGDPSRKAL
jgi:protoporphyrinogen oxidase